MEIEISNAYEKNLQHLDLTIKRHAFTAFTGLSGSGKTSLLKDTLYQEAQRQYLEAMNFQGIQKPKVTDIANLSPAILIDQEDHNENPRSTLGTQTNLYTSLRMIFEKLHQRQCPHCQKNFSAYESPEEIKKNDGNFEVFTRCPHCQEKMEKLTRSHFSFNTEKGACPTCHGLGKSLLLQPTLYDLKKTLGEGGVKTWPSKPYIAYQTASYEALLNHLNLPNITDRKIQDFSPLQFSLLKFGIHAPELTNSQQNNLPKKVAGGKFEGVETVLWKKIAEAKEIPASLAPFLQEGLCPTCHGEKLNTLSRNVTVGETRLPILEEMDLSQLFQWLKNIHSLYPPTALLHVKNYLLDMETKIQRLFQVGLSYLSLNRTSQSLSGGESQRVKLAALLDSKMTELILILDEPTIGLHPEDTQGVLNLIQQLKARGNTILVIEHDLAVLKAADEIIEIGPLSGKKGGQVVAKGSFLDLLQQKQTLTAQAAKLEFQALSHHRPIHKKALKIQHATFHNLKDITVSFPESALSVVTGVSGSGKSSLVFGEIAANMEKQSANFNGLTQFSQCLTIQQKRPTRNRRSVVATYLDLMEEIRHLYAKVAAHEQLNFTAADFSFNSGKGRCPNCQGLGYIESQQLFFENQLLTCPVCQGKRFQDQLLAVKVQGLSINDFLNLTIAEAIPFLKNNSLDPHPLEILEQTNLDYLQLGQTTDTLSGGEMQ